MLVRRRARLAVCVQVLQDQTPLGRYVSSPLFALALGFMLAAAGILPVQSPAYNIVWDWLMPLATALYLLDSADLRRYVLAAPSLCWGAKLSLSTADKNCSSQRLGQCSLDYSIRFLYNQ